MGSLVFRIAGAGAAFTNTYSVEFDRSSALTDYLIAANSTAMDFDGSSDFSFSCWVKWDSAMSTTGWILSKMEASPTFRKGYELGVSSTGAVSARIGESSGTNYRQTGLTGDDVLVNGVWANITMTWDNSLQELTLYKNDGDASTNIYAGNGTISNMSNNDTMTLGRSTRSGAVYYWHGNIDEVSFWSKALSSSEISDIYNSGTPTNLSSHSATSNLTNWWRMGDDSSDDLTANTGQVTDVKGSADLTPKGTTSSSKVEDTP
jgi:hypothetical protein